MILQEDLDALWLTFKLAGISTSLLLLLSIPLAWWLAKTRSPLRAFFETLIALPLVLPPTVLGFYLLIAFNPKGYMSTIAQWVGIESLAFSFTGLVIGSMIYSLPFVVQPIKDSFVQLGSKPLEAAAVLGASPLDRFFSIVLPGSVQGLLSACILGFAHTLGEFGVVLMIGGNIPGETRVVSIAIYDHVYQSSGTTPQAHSLSFILLCTSALLLFTAFALKKKKGSLI